MINSEQPDLLKFSIAGGCGCKIDSKLLHEIIGQSVNIQDERVRQFPHGDAGMISLENGLTLAQSIDFQTPIIDDSYEWGRITAAHALSDLYVSRATPISSLTILAFPVGSISKSTISNILHGATSVFNEVNVKELGGHTINNPQVILGFSVTGVIHDVPRGRKIFKPGDLVYLTKPLGSGSICTAKAVGETVDISEAIYWMKKINAICLDPIISECISDMTDVSGFGLLGHACELMRETGFKLVINSARVPVMQSAVELTAVGFTPSLTYKNIDNIERMLYFNPSISDAVRLLLAEPQTSGGVLCIVPSQSALAFEARLHELNHGSFAHPIGELKTRNDNERLIEVE